MILTLSVTRQLSKYWFPFAIGGFIKRWSKYNVNSRSSKKQVYKISSENLMDQNLNVLHWQDALRKLNNN